MHRDVSPSNVLVCYTGEVKLLDFGIAKASGALVATHQGVVKGKVGYAAPEQCLGKPADPRSDLYAVGVMLWEAVAGRRRSSGETQMSILQGRIQDSEPALEKVCPDAHPALVRVTRRALARAPEMRYATAREFRNALEQYLAAQARKISGQDVAALMRKHFEQDRAELQKIITMFGALASGQSGTQPAVGSGQSGTQPRVPPVPRKIPPPPRRSSSCLPSTCRPGSTCSRPNEEDTSPIPVDDDLLRMSRRGDSMRPFSSGSAERAKRRFGAAGTSRPDRHQPVCSAEARGRTWLWFMSGVLDHRSGRRRDFRHSFQGQRRRRCGRSDRARRARGSHDDRIRPPHPTRLRQRAGFEANQAAGSRCRRTTPRCASTAGC